MSYLRIKVHRAGQAASAIAEGCFAAAKRHTVIFSLFEPDGILPVWVVMDPTAAQLEVHTGKKPMGLWVKKWDETVILIAIPKIFRLPKHVQLFNIKNMQVY